MEKIKIIAFGRIDFQKGNYVKIAGNENWQVSPIEGFQTPVEVFPPNLRAPLGQVEIAFQNPIDVPYAVTVTASIDDNLPLVSANAGGFTDKGFKVHLFETVADRTLVNAGFSFTVITYQK